MVPSGFRRVPIWTPCSARSILDCSKRGGIILDAFAGSGTTLIAAEKTGRRGYGIELDPHYCDVIVKRLTRVAGVEAIHSETGKTFAEIDQERAVDAAVERQPDQRLGKIEGAD